MLLKSGKYFDRLLEVDGPGSLDNPGLRYPMALVGLVLEAAACMFFCRGKGG